MKCSIVCKGSLWSFILEHCLPFWWQSNPWLLFADSLSYACDMELWLQCKLNLSPVFISSSFLPSTALTIIFETSIQAFFNFNISSHLLFIFSNKIRLTIWWKKSRLNRRADCNWNQCVLSFSCESFRGWWEKNIRIILCSALVNLLIPTGRIVLGASAFKRG